METVVLKISAEHPEQETIERASEILRRGGLVAFPTETVYGLGADALNTSAVEKVFQAKGRPADNPLIVHIAEADQIYALASSVSFTAEKLVRNFFPGPLTLVVRRKPIVPNIVTAGLDTVAVRMPSHQVPRALIRKLQQPIVGPSANLSGKPSPTMAQHVFDDLNGKIDMILDAGPTTIGVESTVVDTTTNPPTILRLGGLTMEQLQEVVGEIRLADSIEALRRSPGTRHRHYAPKAKVIIIEQANTLQAQEVISALEKQGQNGAGIFHTVRLNNVSDKDFFLYLSANVQVYSQQMFAALRTLDTKGADVILVEAVPEGGLGRTIMDRLRRAAKDN
jgi:L-threonylcarbamoyladenylate synthase